MSLEKFLERKGLIKKTDSLDVVKPTIVKDDEPDTAKTEDKFHIDYNDLSHLVADNKVSDVADNSVNHTADNVVSEDLVAFTSVPSVEDLNKKSKSQLDKYAEKQFGIILDRRKNKSSMIEDFYIAINKNRTQ